MQQYNTLQCFNATWPQIAERIRQFLRIKWKKGRCHCQKTGQNTNETKNNFQLSC